jgi:hypothetical protein
MAGDVDKCPVCSGSITSGWICMWNGIIGQRVRWQPSPKPGYVRMRVPAGSCHCPSRALERSGRSGGSPLR